MRIQSARLLALSVAAVAATSGALAQQAGMIGPAFPPSAVREQNFDAVFEVKVTTMPSTPVLWNQTPDARWDAVVCNASKSGRGAVKAESTARWGYLDPGVCTMFSSVKDLELATVDADKEWTAKVYLRARR